MGKREAATPILQTFASQRNLLQTSSPDGPIGRSAAPAPLFSKVPGVHLAKRPPETCSGSRLSQRTSGACPTTTPHHQHIALTSVQPCLDAHQQGSCISTFETPRFPNRCCRASWSTSSGKPVPTKPVSLWAPLCTKTAFRSFCLFSGSAMLR